MTVADLTTAQHHERALALLAEADERFHVTTAAYLATVTRAAAHASLALYKEPAKPRTPRAKKPSAPPPAECEWQVDPDGPEVCGALFPEDGEEFCPDHRGGRSMSTASPSRPPTG